MVNTLKNSKKLRAKHLLGALIITSPIFLAACAEGSQAIAIDYDFALATDPINNLNYVKNTSLDRIAPALVDPFIKTGPANNLKSFFPPAPFVQSDVSLDRPSNTSDFSFDTVFAASAANLASREGYGNVNGRFRSLQDFALVGGTGKPTIGEIRENSSIYTFQNPNNANRYLAFTGFTGIERSMWSNGEAITSQDLRDYLEYIFDLRTGSQRLDHWLKNGVRGGVEFVNAQRDYVRKYNRNYSNPWGRRKYVLAPWDTNQTEYIQDPKAKVYEPEIFDSNGNPIDTEDVARIKKAAENFGFYTGQLFLDYSNAEIQANLVHNPEFDLTKEVQPFTLVRDGQSYEVEIVKNLFVNPYQSYELTTGADGVKTITHAINTFSFDENGFTMVFDENLTPSISNLIFRIGKELFPINRKYVETVGEGIDRYGVDPNHFLTASAFTINPAEVVLGPQGFIYLNKNNDYYEADNIVSERIKIYFSTDRTIQYTLFEDGYISQTYVQANRINNYWTNAEYKDLLKKNTGFGTIALGFNLDTETNGNSPIFSSDLRNAIYYAVNRADYLKVAGWDFSFPVNTWTGFGQAKLDDGRNLELFFNGVNTTAADQTTFPLQTIAFADHLAKSFTFEKTERQDQTFAPKTAHFYLEQYKQKHPNTPFVTLRYLHNSTEEQIKAGQYLRERLQEEFNGFIRIDIQALPENTYASFIEEGKYDVIYRNYDYLGGGGEAHNYVASFFRGDGIDSLNQKTIGYKDNPIGSYTYAEYLSELLVDGLFANDARNWLQKVPNLLEPLVTIINQALEDLQLQNDFIMVQQSNDNNPMINAFVTEHLAALVTKAQELAKIHRSFVQQGNTKVDPETYFTPVFVRNALEFGLTSNASLKTSRLKQLFFSFAYKHYDATVFTNITEATRNRLDIKPVHWHKLYEMAFMRDEETVNNYTDRNNRFFSNNFLPAELAEGWSPTEVFNFIASMEKVVRDGAFVVPLAEVDTNWEITKLGGVSSVFRFDLQFAYDFTKPPRPGLPRRAPS